ncbi:Ribonuclease H1 [Frankliniella fusca]|uniref:ribonuclease H n=1 Tax=Frankliniella fusca TaxID=407009 RepID=A0AAE1H4H5_9NEOP|nr:Ribonuclease H1 [Frankliniella fusca]
MSPRGLPLFKDVLRTLRSKKSANMPFYAVARGRQVGVFQSWDLCQENVANYKGAKYKKFETQEDAWNFVKQFRFKSVKPSDREDEAPIAKQMKVDTTKERADDASNSTFDFAAFNVRLTNLENSYQEKIRSLEERLRALENDRSEEGNQSKSGKMATADPSSVAGHSKMSASKRKLLETATDITKPRQYSTTALKRMKPSDDRVEIIDSFSEESSNDVQFKVDSENYVVVYTDGACSKNGAGLENAKAGIGVWFNDGHPLNVSAPVKGRATNNVAEFQAAIAAAEMAAGAGISKLCIVTDSQFVISCMTSWIKSWKKNDWKTNKGEPVVNKEQVLELENALKALDDVKWLHVRGHQGIHGNEQADLLARNGAEKYVYKTHGAHTL